MFKDNGIQLPHRHARQQAGVAAADDEDGPCGPDPSQAMRALFPAGEPAFNAWMQECGTFFGTFGSVFAAPQNAESVCMDSCLPSVLRVFGAMGSSVPNTAECATEKRLYSGLANMIQSVLCSRNHLGIRCGAVMGSFAAEQSSASSAATSGGSDITDGTPDTTIFGWTVPDTSNSSRYAGMCGTFEVAGCCMQTSVSSILGILSPATADAANIITTLDNSMRTIKTACTTAGRVHANIGAGACPLATARNGGISSASLASAPAALAVRRRLQLVFGGDLSTISATQQDTIETYITDEVEAALGVGTVESVVLSSGPSGSIISSVTLASDVSPEDVGALTADVSIIEMAPPSDANGGTLTQTSKPSTVDEPVTSGAASVVSGVLAAAAAAATVMYVL